MIKVIKKYKTIITLGFLATLSLGVFFYTQAQGGGQTSSSPNLQKGLVGHWTLSQDDYNPNTNQVKDLSPYSNHGTNYGATFSQDRQGKEGGAMSFHNNYIDIGQVQDGVIPYSISYWIYLEDGITTSNSQFGIFNCNFSLGNSYPQMNIGNNSSRTTDATIELWYADRSANTFPRTYIKDVFPGGWHHIVLSWNNNLSQYEIFVNSQKRIAYPDNGGHGHVQATSWALNDLKIGRDYANRYAKMKLDDFRVYDRSLSQEEISLLYESYKPQFQASSLESGLIGHWTLSQGDYNSSTNKVSDLTPYSNHGTNYGATFTTDRNGQAGGAMSFDGINNVVVATDAMSSLVDEMTLSLWIKKTENVNSYNMFAGNSRPYFGFYSSGRFLTRNRKSGANVSYYSNNIYEIDKWHHFLITFDYNFIRFYINGTLDNEIYEPGNIDVGLLSDLAIGDGREGTYYPFKGHINDVRLYDRALSQKEISQLYESYKPKLEISSLSKGLVLDMPLTSSSYNENTNRVDDRSVYGNHGLNSNATVLTDSTFFDGNNGNEMITFNNNGLLSSGFNFNFWLYFIGGNRWGTQPTSIGGILENINGRSGNYIYTSHNTLTMRFSFGGVFNQRAISYPKSIHENWHFISINYDGINLKVYLDGEEFYSDPQTGILDLSSSQAIFGKITTYWLIGSLKNAKIYNRPLSAEEVELLYSMGR
jgi:hypothetical protein